MMLKNFLFDLDGTLLPMDLKPFIELYLQAFCKRFADPMQLDPQKLVQGIWDGAVAMGKNDGSCLNREVFWKALNRCCGRDLRMYEKDFDDFYRNEFAAAKKATWENPYAAKTIRLLKEHGRRLIVATNPIFPMAATHARICWAGLRPQDFDYITVYDNCSFSKPQLHYYRDICSFCDVKPEESMMVGNDVDEDMCASRLGMQTYLITDCLINRGGKSVDSFAHGSFRDLYEKLQGELSQT